jgi:glycosyltransferase involved in cell wall biosynthesis
MLAPPKLRGKLTVSSLTSHRIEAATVLMTATDRFPYPLTDGDQKKFTMLSSYRPHYVLAFSKGLRPMTFKAGARFYLLPDVPHARLRQGGFLIAVFVTTIYLALFRRMRVAMSQSVFDGLPIVLARAALTLMKRRIAVVVQVHGDHEAVALLSGKIPSSWRGVLGQLSRFVLGKADVIRTISRFTSAKVEGHIRQETPRFVFPTFTDIDFFLEEEAAPQKDPPYLLSAAVLTHAKGLHVLVEAMRLLSLESIHHDLVIAGGGSSQGSLEKQIARAGLQERVRLMGSVPQARLRQLMRECYAFILPSLSEGFGRVIIEAMACRKPVIASRTGGVPELVRPHHNGLLSEPGDPHDLAEKVRFMLQHPAEAREMGLNGWRFVSQSYSNSEYFRNYRDMVEAALRICDVAERHLH